MYCAKKSMSNRNLRTGEIVIYESPQRPEIRVKLKQNTVWLDARSMAKFLMLTDQLLLSISTIFIRLENLIRNQSVPFWYRFLLMGKFVR